MSARSIKQVIPETKQVSQKKFKIVDNEITNKKLQDDSINPKKSTEYSQIYPLEQQLRRNALQYTLSSFRLKQRSSRLEDGEEELDMSEVVKVEPLSLIWEDLIYRVSQRNFKQKLLRQDGKFKDILKSVNGVALPGQLTAIMGPSGCGKTSLLNSLAGRLPQGGQLYGSLIVNGEPRDNEFKRFSAYVMQDDVLFKTLTVSETLQIAASLRLPRSISRKQKNLISHQVMKELSLSKVANTYVGDESFRGVSGGERKRVNIGVEMMGNPSIMFLDEPTSGLDSFQALSVMRTLWKMTRNGRNIISVIHQPRSQIYQMFDVLYLMSDGMVVYFGNASLAYDYFARQGFRCPMGFTISDFSLDVISMDYRSPKKELASKERVQLFAAAYKTDNDQQAFFENYKQEALKIPSIETNKNNQKLKQNTVFTEFFTLLWRAFMQMERDWGPTVFLVLQQVFLACVNGAIFHDSPNNNQGISNKAGFLYLLPLQFALSQMVAVIYGFPMEKQTVNKERAANMYRTLPYYYSKIIAELPFKVSPAIVYGLITYYIVKLNPNGKRFVRFLIINIVVAISGQAWGYLVSSGFKRLVVPLTIVPALQIIFILYGGFFINTATLPAGSFWVRYLSSTYYGFSLFIQNQFDDPDTFYELTEECGAEPVLVNGPYLLSKPFDARFQTGIKFWEGFVILICMTVILHIIASIIFTLTKQKFTPLKTSKKSSTYNNDSG